MADPACFGPRNIRFLTAPEEDHALMRAYFEERAEEPDFMNFSTCRLIDLAWNREQIHAALRAAR